MYLKRIVIGMDDKVGGKIYASHFDFHVTFIRYSLSRQLRMLKFETDGTFDELIIIVSDKIPEKPIYFGKGDFDGLTMYSFCPFNKQLYDALNEREKCEYYVCLLKETLLKISRIKDIPLSQMNEWLDNLIADHFIYRWPFKKYTIPEIGITLDLESSLSTNEYLLNGTIYRGRGKKKQMIGSGRLVRTKPDELFFSFITKYKVIDNDCVIFTARWGDHLFYLKFEDLEKGKIIVHFPDAPPSKDEEIKELFLNKQKELNYDNNDFI